MKFKIELEISEDDGKVECEDLKSDIIQYLGMAYSIEEIKVERMEEA